MLLPRLLAPVAGRWLRRAQHELDRVPQPDDATRRVAPGRDADRVLLLGNGHVIGFGVRTHELSLTGQLARRLTARTGRGTVVDVAAARGLSIDRAGAVLRARRLASYDAVVVSVGATDAAALTPPARWRAGLARLLDVLDAETSPETTVAVLPIRPMQRLGLTDGPALQLMRTHADVLDRVTAEVVAGRPAAVLLAPDLVHDAARTPEEHLRFADRLAAVLVDGLDAQAASPSVATARARRRGPDPEVLRQAAVDRSGLRGTGSSPVLDRLLQQARDLFGVPTAIVTLVDGDLVTVKAGAVTGGPSVERAIAPCNRTIRQDGAYVVPDLAGEPLSADGTRFYAGHPLESPDGFRIGTLCILDDVPHEGGIDEVALVELATRVEAELWRQMQEDRPAAPSPARRPVLTRE